MRRIRSVRKGSGLVVRPPANGDANSPFRDRIVPADPDAIEKPLAWIVAVLWIFAVGWPIRQPIQRAGRARLRAACALGKPSRGEVFRLIGEPFTRSRAVKRLALSCFLLWTLTSSSGCCLLQEIWYALPGGGNCRLYGLSHCLKKCDPCSGCGEVYWGELSDPPACIGCGPCDQCGHWCGHSCYAGYVPGGYHGPSHEGYTTEYEVGPEAVGVPTPAPPRPAPPATSAPSSAPRQTRRMSPTRTAAAPSGRGPSDAEFGLPQGAKIVSRSDRLVGESTTKPTTRTARPVSQQPTQRISRSRQAVNQATYQSR